MRRIVILQIPPAKLDQARAEMNGLVPHTLGQCVEMYPGERDPDTGEVIITGELDSYWADLSFRDEYFQVLLERIDAYGAAYWVRRNPRTDDHGEPIDPIAESMDAAAAELGLYRKPHADDEL